MFYFHVMTDIYEFTVQGITAHIYEKINVKAYNTVNKFDMICISESHLDSSMLSDNGQLNIEG